MRYHCRLGLFGVGRVFFAEKPCAFRPIQTRRDAKVVKRDRYVTRKFAQTERSTRKEVNVLPEDQFADVFAGPSN